MIACISAIRTQQIRLLGMCTFGRMRSAQQDAILRALLAIMSSQAQPVPLNAAVATLGVSTARTTNNTLAVPAILQHTGSTPQPATTMPLKATASTIPVLPAITASRYRWFARPAQLAARPARPT